MEKYKFNILKLYQSMYFIYEETFKSRYLEELCTIGKHIVHGILFKDANL